MNPIELEREAGLEEGDEYRITGYVGQIEDETKVMTEWLKHGVDADAGAIAVGCDLRGWRDVDIETRGDGDAA